MGTTIDSAVGDGRTPGEHGRAAILHPVDRIMELLFGLLMALSFTGALSVAQAGRVEIREMFIAAFGCNLAWGIVDAVMYLIRTTVDRAKSLIISEISEVMQTTAQAIEDRVNEALEKCFMTKARNAQRAVARAATKAAPAKAAALKAAPVVAKQHQARAS